MGWEACAGVLGTALDTSSGFGGANRGFTFVANLGKDLFATLESTALCRNGVCGPETPSWGTGAGVLAFPWPGKTGVLAAAWPGINGVLAAA